MSKNALVKKNMCEVFDDSVLNQSILDTGNEVGDLAMALFGDFVEVPFSDHYIFEKVLQDKTICTELLERLLHIKIDHIEYP